MYNYIFTCNPKNSELTIYEFRKKDDSYHFITWLDEGVGVFETELSNEELCECIRVEPIIFVRHIFRLVEISSIHKFEDAIVSCCKNNMDKSASFTVQTRWAIHYICFYRR